jgi:uncharacterized surface protein with fasciclin (FAS1) repeats
MKHNLPVRFFISVLALAFAFAAFAPGTALAASNEPEDGPSIVGVAASVNQQSGEFSTLIAALKATGLIKKFDTKGAFTVFAPTDAAFAKLGLNAENIGSLPKAKLMDILGYHVARGDRYAQGVVGANRIRMLNGDYTSPSLNADGAFLDQSKIVTTNIPANNGVIHVIDTVLLPPVE